MSDLELTKNNHFKFGYDLNYFSLRDSAEQKWTIDYGSIQRPVFDWKSECLSTAIEIKKSTKKEIFICLSGGIDSEVTAESFRLAKIPFTAAIMRFSHKLNQHDISWAEKYCEKHHILIKYFEVDVLQFYKTDEFRKIIESTFCFFPMLALQMKLMQWVSEMNGFPIVGSAECYLERQPDHQWVMYEREIYASLYRFQILNKIEGVSGFFQWSPEIMYSFLIDPLIKKLVENQLPNIKSSLEIKQEIYRSHFNTEPRPKYYGWENFSEDEKSIRIKLGQKYSFAQGEAKTLYAEVLAKLNVF